LIITPWYELLFSIELTNQKKTIVNKNDSIEIINKESNKLINIKTTQVNEIYPLPESMALSAKKCVEEVGPILLQEQRGKSQNFIIDEKSNRNGIILKHEKLEKLYHSMMIVEYPSVVKKGQIERIRVSIIPSLGFKRNQKLESESKTNKSSIIDYPKVSISINSSGIQTKKLTPKVSHLVAFSPTHWIFEIKGIEKGNAGLFVFVKNYDSDELLESFEYRFLVNESLFSRFSSFLIKNWQWFASAIIIPLIIAIWKKKIIGRHILRWIRANVGYKII
jgi:hypothetical protein